MKDIFILGSLNMDLTLYLDRFPEKGETLKGHHFRTGAGGKGLNQAIAAAKLGGKVHFLGAVGTDVFGEELKGQLTHYGVDVSHVYSRKDVSSGVALIQVADGENEIGLDLGANETIASTEIEDFLKDAKAGDLFMTQGENNADSLQKSLQIAHKKGLYTLLNPAPAAEEMKESFPYIDLLTPNETEASLLSGDQEPRDAIFSLNVPHIAITLGAKGYLFRDGAAFQSVPAPAVKAIDTTGAGDAFCGSLAFFLASGVSLKGALKLASQYASLKTTRKGTSIVMPTKEEFQNFIKNH
jgi:ribokinase